MSENQHPNHDLLEEAIHAFQRMSVPERPAGTDTLALLHSSPRNLPRRFPTYAIISSAAAAVLLSAGVLLFLWNGSPPESDPAAIAVTKAPGQAKVVTGKEPGGENRALKAERSSLADVPRLEKQLKEEDHSSLPIPPLDERVKESPVIVVATAESFSPAPPTTIPGDTPEVLILFKVKRVLKGKYAAKTFTTRMSNEKFAGRHVVDQMVGKDWIVCLSPNYLAGKSQSAPATSADFEARYKDIIAKQKK